MLSIIFFSFWLFKLHWLMGNDILFWKKKLNLVFEREYLTLTKAISIRWNKFRVIDFAKLGLVLLLRQPFFSLFFSENLILCFFLWGNLFYQDSWMRNLMYQIVIGDLKPLDGEYSDPFLKVCMFEGIVKLSFLLVWIKTQIQLLCKELGAFVINIYRVSSSFWHWVAKCIIFLLLLKI